jgi:hypothetical protein
VLEALDIPKLLIVAAGTLRELPSVDIILHMTLTALLPSSRQLPTILVTLVTGEELMDAHELKVAVEPRGLLPPFLGMTHVAFFAKAAVVDILVTQLAVAGRQVLPDIKTFFVVRGFLKGALCGLMTLHTLGLKVQAF